METIGIETIRGGVALSARSIGHAKMERCWFESAGLKYDVLSLYHTRRPLTSIMNADHKKLVQERFTRTAELFAQHALVDSEEYVRRKIEFIAPQGSELVLDIACGPGTLALELAPVVRHVFGIDLTEKILLLAAETAANRGPAHAAFVRGDVELLPFPADSFDLACCGQSFHHFARPALVLAEMRRVSRRGGRIAIFDSMAPEEEARAALHDQIEKIRDPSHTHTLQHSEFLELFRRTNLVLERELERPRQQWFSKWAERAVLAPETEAYRQCRQMMLDSIAGDRAGLEPKVIGDDIRFIHHEGHFLLRKTG